jgi:hypothetical protein
MLQIGTLWRSLGENLWRTDQTSKLEKLRLLHGLLREVREIAEAERMPFLSHLLEMASIESGDVLRSTNPMHARPKPNQ